ncbi:MAG: adenylate/guanylate cyclase domain-containing protein [Spirochaetales bacterium]|nr:adenylate/guanylate cyclase domain-containing protein [Spirochaetales bacterium]MCF7937524.1 adenylate/guanylate cyclase domain-containing protein [Spirochaetales bacterium]
MGIRLKIILVVLPLLVAMLFLAGFTASQSARSGMTRIAIEALGFKAQELNKYAENQWELLQSNNLTDRSEYIEVTKKAVTSYAESIIRTDSEMIFAVDPDGNVTMSTREIELSGKEKAEILTHMINERQGWVRVNAGGKDRVGQAFFLRSFDWYVMVTEETESFYREVNEINRQTYIILGASLVLGIILLLIFAGYLTRPVAKVVAAMKDIISRNDLSSRVAVEYNDEIGTLAHTFNIMIGELDRSYQQIKSYAFKAVLAQKNEMKIRNIFQKYVPKDVIDSFFTNPESMLVGENRVLAILFSDIRSFTTISEGFMPDELVTALNRYFEIMVEIIMNNEGIIDKYIGDAIMAFFGAPVKHENDAFLALMAALDMQEALEKFNKEQIEAGKPAFNTGIGINYGIVTVGNIGSEKKMDYTVIGDMVNLASRLEGLTKEYKQGLIFSESVFRKTKDQIHCRLIDKVRVKGKTVGENIYTARRELSDREKRAWGYHHGGLKRYYARDFEGAIKQFQGVLELLPDDFIAKMYIERCRQYIASPPPENWNGIHIMKSK